MTTTTVDSPAAVKTEAGTIKSGSASGSQVVSFRLGNEEYGLNIMLVQEIILMGDITEIPEVPAYIRGLINLRGKVIPIIDLRLRFGLEAGPEDEHTRIIVVNASGVVFGIVVDAVNEVLRIDPNKVEKPPQGLITLEQAYIDGLLKLEQKIMILLNIETILSQVDKAAVADAAAA